MEPLIYAFAGGAVVAAALTFYQHWKKDARLRNLKAAAAKIAAAQAVDGADAAKEAEKRAIDEKYAIQAIQEAASKL